MFTKKINLIIISLILFISCDKKSEETDCTYSPPKYVASTSQYSYNNSSYKSSNGSYSSGCYVKYAFWVDEKLVKLLEYDSIVVFNGSKRLVSLEKNNSFAQEPNCQDIKDTVRFNTYYDNIFKKDGYSFEAKFYLNSDIQYIQYLTNNPTDSKCISLKIDY